MAKNNIVFSMILNNTDFVKKMNWSWKETQKFERRVNKTGGALKEMAMGGLTPMLGKLGAFAGGTALVAGALSRATEKMMALDTAMADMKALTGATTEQMEQFKIAAIGMSASSTVAADEIIRAMIKVGGSMPQLLKFQQGLISVTQSAVTLSEASGMTLDDSIKSLTGMMNQFSASAIDADRYINVLAAAAQAGSAEIDYLAMAVAKSGGAATSANLEFEELVALIEAVAPKFGQAEEAGTALRGVLLKMETGSEKTKISTQGLAKALDELAKMSSNELLKQFGMEGFNMAKAMADARDSFAKFNTEVRGTNAAQEQAAMRADNLTTAIDSLVNKWDAITLSINQSNGPLTKFVNLLGDALDAVDMLLPNYDKWARQQDKVAQELGMKEAANIVESKKASGMTEKAAVKEALGESNAKLAKMRQTEEWMKKLAPEKIATPKSGADDSWFGDVADYILSATPAGMGKQLVDFLEHRKGELNKMDHESPLTLLQREIKAEEAKSAILADKLNGLNGKKKGPGKGGDDPTATDPIAAVRADLKNKGMNPDEIEKSITDMDLLKKKVSELDKAIEANANNPQAQKGLKELRDYYKILLGDVEKGAQVKATVVAGLDVTQLANTRDRVKELEGQIKELEDLLKFDSDNAGLITKIKELRAELAQLKPNAAAVTAPSSTYTNPWDQNYKDNWQNGNSHQKIDFAEDVAGSITSGLNSAGALVAEIPGLEGLGDGISKLTSTLMNVISVVQMVSSIIQLSNTISTVSAMKPGFSDGGIIGGNSWTGDKLLARVNSGELVLNQKQQKNLLAGLNSSGISAGGIGVGEVRLRGEDLYVTLGNYKKRTGKR